jgi:hypothetical protein
LMFSIAGWMLKRTLDQVSDLRVVVARHEERLGVLEDVLAGQAELAKGIHEIRDRLTRIEVMESVRRGSTGHSEV